MNIEELVKREAGSDSEHDKNYANSLRAAYRVYSDKTKDELIDLQEQARKRYKLNGNTHNNVASCIVIMELLKDTP